MANAVGTHPVFVDTSEALTVVVEEAKAVLADVDATAKDVTNAVADIEDAVEELAEPTPEPTPEPTVKVCPFCYSEIPYKATRCAHCTSVLESKND